MAKKKTKNKEKATEAPSRFYNRELSWLSFNSRVLEEAQDRKNPVFERLKFLAITSSNLDEFFMVRVSGLLTQIESGYNRPDIAGLSPTRQLEEISKGAHKFVQDQYNCIKRSIIPQLEKSGYYFLAPKDATAEQREFIDEYFHSELFPILTPMAIDQSRPFPLLQNKSLNIIVQLSAPEKENEVIYAVVQVPSVQSRILELPRQREKAIREFVFLEDIIKLHLPALFQGHTVRKSYCFRITRNSDLEFQEDDSEDLLHVIEKSIQKRRWGEPNRLEAEKEIADDVLEYLCNALDFDDDDVYKISGLLDLTVLFQFYAKGAAEYKDEPATPQPVTDFLGAEDLFEVIRERDVLAHHPYQSFDCVVKFIRDAAADPSVLAIKQTLYRVSGNSPIIQALINAAKSGKQVTVLVELKARFDEENNINWARKLEQAGCHVVYGLAGLKTHCKICLVVRKEEEGIRRYIHLGTGNYNDSTAKTYTDMSYFTSKETFGSDISALFNALTGYSETPEWKKIAVAPKSLRSTFEAWIENEISFAKSGVESHIIIKVNSLVDEGMIEMLYKAAKNGVKVDMIVRGICCLRAGVPGFSENIRVISIVGRFLEHSRIYYFSNGGNPKIFLSSADLMPRNLDRRVEVAFPIEQEDLKERIRALLELTLEDTVKTRILMPDGTYERVPKARKDAVHSQVAFQKEAEAVYAEYMEENKPDDFMPIMELS